MLISLSGRSCTGKTTVARQVARDLAAVYLHVKAIEHSMRGEGWPVDGEGYSVAHTVAEENLRLGRIVVADAINPWPMTRVHWRAVATRVGVRIIDVELVCSDEREHRRRVEAYLSLSADSKPPTWQQVAEADYHPWEGDQIVLDTARLTIDDTVAAILANVSRPPERAS
jgi:predicted kinase